jgi:hypothetical protein
VRTRAFDRLNAVPPLMVTASIGGVLAPLTAPLPDAIPALWAALRELALGWTQYDALRYHFGPGAVERIEGVLRRGESHTLEVQISGRSHIVLITSADRQRLAAGAAPC